MASDDSLHWNRLVQKEVASISRPLFTLLSEPQHRQSPSLTPSSTSLCLLPHLVDLDTSLYPRHYHPVSSATPPSHPRPSRYPDNCAREMATSRQGPWTQTRRLHSSRCAARLRQSTVEDKEAMEEVLSQPIDVSIAFQEHRSQWRFSSSPLATTATADSGSPGPTLATRSSIHRMRTSIWPSSIWQPQRVVNGSMSRFVENGDPGGEPKCRPGVAGVGSRTARCVVISRTAVPVVRSPVRVSLNGAILMT